MLTKPQLLAWFLCDGVHIDPATGKHYILGAFSNIRVTEFPIVYPQMIWFLCISDVQTGKHHLKISIGIPMEKERVIVDRSFTSKGPTFRINLINEIQNLSFDKEGDYSIIIEIDNEALLVTSLHVSV